MSYKKIIRNSTYVFFTILKFIKKTTSVEHCLTGNSRCVVRYKISVVISYVNRIYKVTKTLEDFNQEI